MPPIQWKCTTSCNPSHAASTNSSQLWFSSLAMHPGHLGVLSGQRCRWLGPAPAPEFPQRIWGGGLRIFISNKFPWCWHCWSGTHSEVPSSPVTFQEALALSRCTCEWVKLPFPQPNNQLLNHFSNFITHISHLGSLLKCIFLLGRGGRVSFGVMPMLLGLGPNSNWKLYKLYQVD